MENIVPNLKGPPTFSFNFEEGKAEHEKLDNQLKELKQKIRKYISDTAKLQSLDAILLEDYSAKLSEGKNEDIIDAAFENLLSVSGSPGSETVTGLDQIIASLTTSLTTADEATKEELGQRPVEDIV